jgi:ankyrin repeat protein
MSPLMAALHRAIRSGDSVATRAACKTAQLSGVSVFARDSNTHALHVASESGSAAVLDTLLDQGGLEARVGLEAPLRVGPNERDGWRGAMEDGFKPLHCGARVGDAAVVRLLILRGSDVESSSGGVWGLRPLHVAVLKEQAEVVEVLLEQGAKIDAVTGARFDGSTALHLASALGAYKLVERLLQAGATIAATNDRKQTPLFLAQRLVAKAEKRITQGAPDAEPTLERGKKTVLKLLQPQPKL